MDSGCHIHAEIEERIKFIEKNKDKHNVRLLCKVLKVPRSVYYYHQQRKVNSYEESNKELDKKILGKYNNSKGRYGSPKIKKELEKDGIKVSQKRVARRMKILGIKSVIIKKYNPGPAKSKVDDTNKLNLLKQEFKAKQLREKLVSDITYIYQRARLDILSNSNGLI